jgi:hypothetical protein
VAALRWIGWAISTFCGWMLLCLILGMVFGWSQFLRVLPTPECMWRGTTFVFFQAECGNRVGDYLLNILYFPADLWLIMPTFWMHETLPFFRDPSLKEAGILLPVLPQMVFSPLGLLTFKCIAVAALGTRHWYRRSKLFGWVVGAVYPCWCFYSAGWIR